jgi:hypothetical protein
MKTIHKFLESGLVVCRQAAVAILYPSFLPEDTAVSQVQDFPFFPFLLHLGPQIFVCVHTF